MSTRTYRLTVEGELGDHMASAFPGMTLASGEGTTTLTGDLRDQAELHGVLRRVSDLGLTLLETKAVGERPRATRRANPSPRSHPKGGEVTRYHGEHGSEPPPRR